VEAQVVERTLIPFEFHLVSNQVAIEGDGMLQTISSEKESL
jgi:hypothetical protein